MYILSHKQTGVNTTAWSIWVTDNEDLVGVDPIPSNRLDDVEYYYLIALPAPDTHLNPSIRNSHSSLVQSDIKMVDLYRRNVNLLWTLAEQANRAIREMGIVDHNEIVYSDEDLDNYQYGTYSDLVDVLSVYFVLQRRNPKDSLVILQTDLLTDLPIPRPLTTPVSGVLYKVLIEGQKAAKNLICIGPSAASRSTSWLEKSTGNVYHSNHFDTVRLYNGFPIYYRSKDGDVPETTKAHIAQYGDRNYVGTIKEIVPQYYLGFTKGIIGPVVIDQCKETKLAQIIFWTGAEFKAYAGPVKMIDIGEHALRTNYNDNLYKPQNQDVSRRYLVLQQYETHGVGPYLTEVSNVIHIKLLKEEISYHNTEIEL